MGELDDALNIRRDIGSMQIFGENEHPVEHLFDRLEAGEKLEGLEALAVLAGSFSNATHNSYSAEQLVNRTGLTQRYKLTLEKL